MTATQRLDPEVAFAAGLEVIAAWPCSPSEGPDWRGWPSRTWERQYRDLRKRLLVGPQPKATDAAMEIFELQRQLRDALEERHPPPDIADGWAQSFAAFCRAGDIVEGRRAGRPDEGGR